MIYFWTGIQPQIRRRGRVSSPGRFRFRVRTSASIYFPFKGTCTRGELSWVVARAHDLHEGGGLWFRAFCLVEEGAGGYPIEHQHPLVSVSFWLFTSFSWTSTGCKGGEPGTLLALLIILGLHLPCKSSNSCFVNFSCRMSVENYLVSHEWPSGKSRVEYCAIDALL